MLNILTKIIENLDFRPEDENDFRNYVSDGLLKQNLQKLHMEEKFYDGRIDMYFVLNNINTYIEFKYDRKGDCNTDKRKSFFADRERLELLKEEKSDKTVNCFCIFLSEVECDYNGSSRKNEEKNPLSNENWLDTKVSGLKFLIKQI